MGLSASTYSLEGVQPSKPNSNSTMFRFVALFALVAVAAAEPESDSDAFMQYHHGDEAHMKTVTGDTASVAAAKEDHFQMKAAEYAKKGYAAPYAYGSFPYQTYGYAYEHQQQFVYKTPMVNAAVYKNHVATPAVYNTAAVRPVVYKNQVAQQQFVYKTPSVYTPATYAHSVVPASTYAMPTYTQGAYSAYPYHHLESVMLKPNLMPGTTTPTLMPPTHNSTTDSTTESTMESTTESTTVFMVPVLEYTMLTQPTSMELESMVPTHTHNTANSNKDFRYSNV